MQSDGISAPSLPSIRVDSSCPNSKDLDNSVYSSELLIQGGGGHPISTNDIVDFCITKLQLPD